MKRSATTIKSKALGQSMALVSYGQAGYPVIAFATQNQKAAEIEAEGMVEALSDLIEAGKIQLFAVDSVDEQSWSNTKATNEERSERQEDFFTFVTDELVPKVQKLNKSTLRPLAVGCSMGAVHAALAALRRPDLFQGCVSLSGVYHSGYFFGDWMDATLYHNDPCAFLPNMPADHPYVDVYKQRQFVFCSGQGEGEEGLADLQAIHAQLDRLGVGNWADVWGADVTHSWSWWNKQIAYFMPYVLEDIEKYVDLAAAKPAAAKKKATAKPTAAKAAKAAEAKPAAKKAAAAKPAAKAAAKPAAKAEEPKAAEVKPAAAAKPAAKKAAAPKAAAKPAAPKAAEKAEEPKAAEVKPAAAAKPAAKKAAAKPAAKKAEAPKAATTKKAASKKSK